MPGRSESRRPLRIVVAERRGWTARTLMSVLEAAEWGLTHVRTGAAALALSPRERPDVFVLHDDLEDIDAVELCGKLRRDTVIGLTTPVVIISTDPSRMRKASALRTGAWDYAVLPLDAELFLLKLESFARAHREIEQLVDAALLDVETGLYNPAGVARRSGEIASDARRRHDPVSALALVPVSARPSGDVADSEGPDLVTELGRAIRRSGRASDLIGRLNGTLVLVAPATPAAGAERLVERLRGQIAADAAEPGDQVEGLGIRAAYCTAADFARSTLSISEMVERAQAMLLTAASADSAVTLVPGELVPLEESP
jgi:PleD family two-component response regulator